MVYNSQEDYHTFDIISGKNNSSNIHLHLVNISAVIFGNHISLIKTDKFNKLENDIKIQFEANKKEIFKIYIDEFSKIHDLNMLYNLYKAHLLEVDLLSDFLEDSSSNPYTTSSSFETIIPQYSNLHGNKESKEE
jgi:hypothetical protein